MNTSNVKKIPETEIRHRHLKKWTPAWIVQTRHGTNRIHPQRSNRENQVFLYFIPYFQWREIVRDYQFKSLGKSP
jgi:hypothetical protein